MTSGDPDRPAEDGDPAHAPLPALAMTPQKCRDGRIGGGWSLVSLARAAGLPPSLVLAYERGMACDPEVAEKLGAVFGAERRGRPTPTRGRAWRRNPWGPPTSR